MGVDLSTDKFYVDFKQPAKLYAEAFPWLSGGLYYIILDRFEGSEEFEKNIPA